MEIENFILKYYQETDVWLPDGPQPTKARPLPSEGKRGSHIEKMTANADF